MGTRQPLLPQGHQKGQDLGLLDKRGSLNYTLSGVSGHSYSYRVLLQEMNAPALHTCQLILQLSSYEV